VLKAEDTRFIYFGSALAVGASVEQPMKDSLTEQTSVFLSPAGGHAVQTRERTNFREIIRTGHLSATVIGCADEDDHFSTVATATIEKLDIMGFIKADAIVSRVAALYRKDTKEDGYLHPSIFYLHGSAFHGLKINGKHYDPQIADCGIDIPQDRYGREIYAVGEDSGFRLTADGVGTKRVEVMEFPEFGRVFLGEFDIFKGRASLTMLRVEFGCTVRGKFTGPVACTNGHKGP
jgi:hypothetical protein